MSYITSFTSAAGVAQAPEVMTTHLLGSLPELHREDCRV